MSENNMGWKEFTQPMIMGFGRFFQSNPFGAIALIILGLILFLWFFGILVKWGIVLALLGIGIWFLYGAATSKRFDKAKTAAGISLFAIGIFAYLQLFSNYSFIPGLFSFQSSVQTMSMETGQTITTSGWTLTPPLNYFVLITAGIAILSGIKNVRRKR